MMQFRYLAHAVLASALAAGCSQSLFDAGTGGSGDGSHDAGSEPVPDAREGTPDATEGIPDAPAGTPDAGMATPNDGGATPDGGGVSPDASQCPAPCFYNDDAFEDFDGSPDGKNGRWGYVEVQPDGYEAMATANIGGLPGFRGTGTPAPTLTYCISADETEPPCDELFGFLALTTTAPDAHHPALRWTAPESGFYNVYAIYRAASDAPGVETIVMLTRNSQSDVLDSQRLVITEVANELTVPVNVDKGDVIVLSAIATTETPVSVGVNFSVTGPD